MRVPVVSAASPVWPLRGLELQLAGRADHYAVSEPNYEDYIAGDSTADLHARQTTLAFTAGAKVTPIEGLTFRASYATGYLPPQPGDIVPFVDTTTDILNDPKRPGSTAATTFRDVEAGSPRLQPAQARTLAMGAIWQPPFVPGLRISLDYTRIYQTHQITAFASGDDDYFLQNEAAYPSHVIRAPLTAADAALGYTGGVITEIDATELNTGHSSVRAVDLSIDYVHSFPLGELHLFGSGAWEPSYRVKDDPFAAGIQLADQANGPPALKANFGAAWRTHRWRASLSGQYTGRYQVSVAEYGPLIQYQNDAYIEAQGASTIPDQVYVDGGIAYVASQWGRDVTYRFAVANIFDRSPPLVVPATLGFESGYSLYGDPRGRRFTVSVGVAF
jgi:iron complex outermembrane receptor protein